MSIKANQLLQNAGSSMFEAKQALDIVVKEYEVAVSEAMRSSPFSVETDGLYETWKATARLAQEAGTLESRLKDIFEHSPTSGENGQLRAVSLLTTSSSAPTDVQVKFPSVKAPATRVKKPKLVLPAEPPVSPEPEQEATPVKVKSVRKTLTSNASKVLTYLKGAMEASKFEKLTQTTVAKESGIPQGSITASLGVLVNMGYLKEGKNDKKGWYRLSTKV